MYLVSYKGLQMQYVSDVPVYVTGFWKTDQIVTLVLSILLAQLMATLVRYTYTVQLPGLVNWSAFLERVLPTL